MIDLFVKYSPVKDRAVFADMKWSELDPDGRVSMESLVDQQDFARTRGLDNAERRIALSGGCPGVAAAGAVCAGAPGETGAGVA